MADGSRIVADGNTRAQVEEQRSDGTPGKGAQSLGKTGRPAHIPKLLKRRRMGEDVAKSSDFVIDDLESGPWTQPIRLPRLALEPGKSVRRVEGPRRLPG
jgi:hypothetical protein